MFKSPARERPIVATFEEFLDIMWRTSGPFVLAAMQNPTMLSWLSQAWVAGADAERKRG